MEIIYGLEAFPPHRIPIVLALGTFDGVHRGHQVLIADALKRARSLGGRCAVLTFDPHPAAILAPPIENFLLTTLEERLELFEHLGVDVAVIARFDEGLSQMSAEAWVNALVACIRMTGVVCGPSYTFGRDRQGDSNLLRQLAASRGFHVWVATPLDVDGERVSSSWIRRLLHAGQVSDAAQLLGRRYSLRGIVVHGAGRGRGMGYPTANLQIPLAKLIPSTGIYAAQARAIGGEWTAAVSIGTRPTFGPGPRQVEAYLLKFTGNLYDSLLELRFVTRIRDEVAFASVQELVAQMESDVAAVTSVLKTEVGPLGWSERVLE